MRTWRDEFEKELADRQWKWKKHRETGYDWTIFRPPDPDDTYSRLRSRNFSGKSKHYAEAFDKLDEIIPIVKHICHNSFDDIVKIVKEYLEKEGKE